MTQRNYSLKKRLLLWVSIPLLTASLLILLMAFLFSWHEIEEVYDAQLVHSAKTLLQLTENEIREKESLNISLGEENPNLMHKYENKMAFRIWHDDNTILQSPHAKNFIGIEAPPGFSDQEINGKPWRFFVFIDPQSKIRIETAERYSIRYELAGQLMTSMAIPMGILIPLLLLIVWIGVRQSLLPLTILSSDVDRRRIDDVTPIVPEQAPDEVIPLVQALNHLFVRISESFRREREFTDHAAHELRTPLAAMKTQTQVLMKKSAAMPDCRDGLENLNATIDRTGHLVEQLLSLARLQNSALPLSPVNLSEWVHDALSEITGAATARNLHLSQDIASSVHIKGEADALYILIRNLLDNAVKYTPEGGAISVKLSEDAMLTIADTGPGIADADKQRVFSRFIRVDKTGQTGSGLGLSIVEWIAQAHDARIALLDNTPRGLIVEIRFKQ